jgi:arsenate reductase
VFFGGNGQPVKVHWGYPDPSLTQGSDEDKQRAFAFELTRQAIAYRLLQLLQLPLGTMGKPELQAALTTIARS